MRVWITKYALSTGIEFIENAKQHGPNISVPRGSGFFLERYFGMGDWHTSFDAAMAKVEEMIAKREKSLRKALAKLQTLQFVDPAPADGEAGLSGDVAGE